MHPRILPTPFGKAKRPLPSSLFWLAVIGFLLSSVTCASKKNLTSSTGRSMLQDSLDKDELRGNYFVDYGQQEEFVDKPTFEDFEKGFFPAGGVGDALKRLMAAGYLGRAVETFSIQDIGGSYRGSWGNESVSLNLALRPGTNLFSGSFRTEYTQYPGECFGGGTVTAIVEKAGPVSLDFNHKTNRYGCVMRGPPPPKVRITSGDGRLTLEGTCQGDYGGGWPTVGWRTRTCRVGLTNTGGSLPQVNITRFRYRYSQSFLKLVSKPGALQAGRVRVDKLDSLLLDPGGATAHGRFFWHVDLNEPSTIIAGKKRIEGEGGVLFGKQPDGDWVVVREFGIR